MQGPLPAILVGFASGILSGAFGIGGGLVTTPAIRLLLGYAPLIAVGTPLPVIIPGAITGAISYHRRGLADLRAGLTMGFVGIIGSVGGALLTTYVAGEIVLVATGGVIVWAATDMLLQIRRARTSGGGAEAVGPAIPGEGESDEWLVPAAGTSGSTAAWRLALIGLLAGFYSGFLGLGGGFIVVPALTRFCGMRVKRAIGTSLITVATLAVPGTITHFLIGHVNVALALLLAIGVVPGAWLGARLTERASDRAIQIAFAVLLIVVGVWLAANELVPLMR